MGQANAHHHHLSGEKRIKGAFLINLAFTIIELVGGLYTNSLAIISDAIHDLGDCLTLGVAWYFEKISSKGRDQRYSYGYRRFSLLGALMSGIVLIIGSIFIIQVAIPRLILPAETDAKGMMLVAILGILFNGFAFAKLSGGHGYNERLVSLHLLEDVLGWVAVLVGSIVIYFTDYYRVDSILSLVIALFILFNVFRNLKSSMNIVLQGIPEDINIDHIQGVLEGQEGVHSIHDLHIWSMDGKTNILTAHIVSLKELSWDEMQALKGEIIEKMKTEGIAHCTLEFESPDYECDLIDH